jgi:hypothetical protein
MGTHVGEEMTVVHRAAAATATPVKGNRRVSRLTRRPIGVLLALIASAAVPLAAAGPASAAGVYASGNDDSHGAFAAARTFYNNGTYARVWVSDIKADYKCANARLRWTHDNGNVYYDAVPKACGNGVNKPPFDTMPRNQTKYQEVDLQIWVDGGSVTTLELEDF